jgi:outer membrane lipoprotein-sorting protein
MSPPPKKDDWARAHEIFKQNHEAGRERLLGMLSDEVFPKTTVRRRSMRSVIRVLAARPFLSHWKSKLTVAATLLAALTISLFALRHGAEQTAYGLEDLPKRLLEIKSIYLTGWIFEPTFDPAEKGKENESPKKYPIKIFAERPDCYWHTSYGFSGPDMNHKDVRVTSRTVAGEGNKMLFVSHDEKTAMEVPVAELRNELMTETLLQSQIPQQWLSGHLSEYVKTDVETVNNVPCDVYERSMDAIRRKSRLWLDSKTGLPAQIASYDIDKNGQERLAQIIDHVEVNIPASVTGLSFDPPEGYQVTKIPQPTAQQPKTMLTLDALSSAGQDKDGVSTSMGSWYVFNLDDKAVLCCWYCDRKPESKDNAKITPEFMLGAAHPCEHKEIASADVEEHHWNWSLVFPKQVGDRIGDDFFKIAYRVPNGGSMNLEDVPLRLPEDRLQAILAEVQQTSKTTMPNTSEPFTLDTLRKIIAERR